MTPERWKKVENILEAALDRPSGERAQFLADACAGDEALQDQVRTLINSYESAGSFIERPAVGGIYESGAETAGDASSPWVGRRLGSYKIVREIGRGGMGAVFLAVRADDEYQKRVAIKLVKRGMDTDFVLRRFRQERQILASLDHPYIARLLDGGTSEEGLPYFVMEYIEGQPIHYYCDARRLSTVERLKLFAAVCSAVAYAHHNLVVHRDLKPTNVLVAADGTPKLLDFGIAKLMNPEIGSPALDPTTMALRLMTPEYASPEQVRGEAVTTASDVYSLGVLLYELLTGHRPYRFRNRNPEEIARVICEQTPERPSVIVNSIEVISYDEVSEPLEITPESVSRARDGSLEKLRRQLAGSLDNITLKALRKESQRRYQSVSEMAADIAAFLDGRAVAAYYDSPALPPVPLTTPTVIDADGHESPSVGAKSVAVLPFKMLRAEESRDEFLGMSVADAIITRLSNVPSVIVRPTSSVIKYFDGEQNALTAGHELNVDFVLDGRIRRVADRVRVTVQLVRMSDGAPLWAGKFDEGFTDVFSIEDSISEQVVDALLPRLTGDETGPTAISGTDSFSGDFVSRPQSAPTLQHGPSVAPVASSAAAPTAVVYGAAPTDEVVTGEHATNGAGETSARHGPLLRALLLALLLPAVVGAGYGLYRYVSPGGAAPTVTAFQAGKSTRLTNNGVTLSAAIAPDGRYVAYVTLEGGRQGLWVRQVAVANSVRLVAPADFEFRGITFSRDGDYVYYVGADAKSESAALYRVPALGGSAKKIKDGVDSPVGISFDDRRMAFVRQDVARGEDALIVADADGANERALVARRFPAHLSKSSAPAWSPDGERVACVVESSDANGFLMQPVAVRIGDGAEEVISSGRRWLDIGQMAWLPNGNALLAAAQAQDSPFFHLWQLAYPENVTTARRVTTNLVSYRGLSLTANGDAAVSVERQMLTNIWIAPANDLSRPAPVTAGAGRYFDLAWTPDGKVLYASDVSGSGDLWEMMPNGTEQKQLTAGAGRNYAPVASPDNRYVVFHSNRSGAWQIWRMERDGGNPTQLTADAQDSNWPQITPDGRWVIYEHPGPGTLPTIWRVPLVKEEGASAAPQRLGRRLATRPSVSPDGQLIAHWHKDEKPGAPWQIAITPLDGGEPIKIFDLPQSASSGNTGLRWSADGRGVVYVDFRNGVTNLWRQPAAGGAPTKLTDLANDLIYAFDFARDGRLVLSRGVITNDVVLIDGKAPPE